MHLEPLQKKTKKRTLTQARRRPSTTKKPKTLTQAKKTHSHRRLRETRHTHLSKRKPSATNKGDQETKRHSLKNEGDPVQPPNASERP